MEKWLNLSFKRHVLYSNEFFFFCLPAKSLLGSEDPITRYESMSVTTQFEVVIKWTSLLVSSSECYLDLYLTKSTNLQIMRRQLEAVFKELALSRQSENIEIHHFQKILFLWFVVFFNWTMIVWTLNSNNWQSDTIDWHYWQPIKLADLWILRRLIFSYHPPALQLSGWHAMVFADTANLLLWVWQGSSSVPPIQIKLFRFSPYMSKPTMLLVKSFPRR